MDAPNIIVIIFDTLRKDSLGCYGGKVPTPHIDKFAAEAVKFERTISPSPWTLPTHASMITGKYALEHRIHETFDKKIEHISAMMNIIKEERLTAVLKKRGYNCTALSANPVVSSGTGFEIGFNQFVDVPTMPDVTDEMNYLVNVLPDAARFRASDASRYLISHGKLITLYKAYRQYQKAKKKIERAGYPVDKGGGHAISMVERSSYELPLFLFVNFMEMHDPYLSFESPLLKTHSNHIQLMDLMRLQAIPPTQMNRIRNAYFERASEIDKNFGRFLKHLKESSLFDNSLIILTSDHGQSLHERGYYGHGIFLYDELIRVPLIIKPPAGYRLSSKPENTQSLCAIYELIRRASEGESNIEMPMTDIAFSESYGMQHSMSEISTNNVLELEKARRLLDVPRKAVYKGPYKLQVQGNDGVIEEFAMNGRALAPSENKQILGELLNELELFKGQEKFNLPSS